MEIVFCTVVLGLCVNCDNPTLPLLFLCSVKKLSFWSTPLWFIDDVSLYSYHD